MRSRVWISSRKKFLAGWEMVNWWSEITVKLEYIFLHLIIRKQRRLQCDFEAYRLDMRISRKAFELQPKPRDGLSICIELAPKSKITPSTSPRTQPAWWRRGAHWLNRAWIGTTRLQSKRINARHRAKFKCLVLGLAFKFSKKNG